MYNLQAFNGVTTNLNLHQETQVYFLCEIQHTSCSHKPKPAHLTNSPLRRQRNHLEHISVPFTFSVLLQLPSIPRRGKVRHRTWIAKPIRHATCKICRARGPLSSDHKGSNRPPTPPPNGALSHTQLCYEAPEHAQRPVDAIPANRTSATHIHPAADSAANQLPQHHHHTCSPRTPFLPLPDTHTHKKKTSKQAHNPRNLPTPPLLPPPTPATALRTTPNALPDVLRLHKKAPGRASRFPQETGGNVTTHTHTRRLRSRKRENEPIKPR